MNVVDRPNFVRSEALDSCPFYLHETIIEQVVLLFDEALWQFRSLVRNVEKVSLTTSQARLQRFFSLTCWQSRFEKESPENIRDKYRWMHELSRHVFHQTETLESGVRVLSSINNAYQAFCGIQIDELNVSHYREAQAKLSAYQLLLDSLTARAKSFEQRLSNEILLVST